MDERIRRILVLDDDPGAAAPLELLLRRRGYDGVAVEADVRRTLRNLGQIDADLVVVNDGRRTDVPRRPAVPLVVLGHRSGAGHQSDRVSLIARPLDVDAFFAAVAELLELPVDDGEGDVVIDLREGARERVRYCDAGLLQRLAEALADTHPAAAARSERVAELASALAIAAGLDEHTVGRLRAAARFCDIGLLGVPSGVTHLEPEPGQATDPDWWRLHPELGASLLAPAQGEVAGLAREIALHHHERWDGTGFPQALAGELIPFEARVVAVADAWVSATTGAAGDPWVERVALREVRTLAGTALDPRLVDLLPAALSGVQQNLPL